MYAPVGKSGPLMCFIRPSTSIVGSSIIATTASIVSPRLCGGMFVAMPTAMPAEPLTSRFGKRDGSTDGSPQRLVVVRPEVDGVRVDVAQHLRRHPRETRLGVVADEAVRQERVVVRVDPQRVDRLHAGVFDRLDLGVVVIARHERRDNRPDFVRGDPLHDRGAAAIPALEAIDVVPAQPVLVDPARPAVGADVVRHVGHVVAAERRALAAGSRASAASSFACLAPRKPTSSAKLRASRRFVITTLISPFA